VRRMICLLIVLAGRITLAAIPVVAQSGDAAKPVQISGAVLSLSGNTLDLKPAASPAVWVVIPDGVAADRGALKPGAEVTVEAHWAELCYIATQVTVKK
jgi:hypothetical protein